MKILSIRVYSTTDFLCSRSTCHHSTTGSEKSEVFYLKTIISWFLDAKNIAFVNAFFIRSLPLLEIWSDKNITIQNVLTVKMKKSD